MAKAGILDSDERVELLDGQVIQMSPIGTPHGAHVDALTRQFTLQAGERWVRIQGAIQLDNYNQPQPDVALLREREGGYRDRQPAPQDVLLVVEVSDSTLEKDEKAKLRLYAQAAIPEVRIFG